MALGRGWTDQRWLLDNIIQANGIDWEQPRSIYWNVPCGMEASADFAAIRARVKKYAGCRSSGSHVAQFHQFTPK